MSVMKCIHYINNSRYNLIIVLLIYNQYFIIKNTIYDIIKMEIYNTSCNGYI